GDWSSDVCSSDLDPFTMLDYVGRGLLSTFGDRKLQLFACGCCRRIWHLLPDDACRRGVEAAEGYADGLLEKGRLQQTRKAVDSAWRADANRRRTRRNVKASPSRNGYAYEAVSSAMFWDFT